MSEYQLPIRSDIGDYGMMESDFAEHIAAAKDHSSIRLLIACDGGVCFTAWSACAQLLATGKPIRTTIESICASAATFFLTISEHVEAYEFAQIMVHEASAGAVNNAPGLRKLAATLDSLDDQISAGYQRRTGAPKASWRAAMAEELWLNASEAQTVGLVDTVLPAGPSGHPVTASKSIRRPPAATALYNHLVGTRKRSVPLSPDLAAIAARAAYVTNEHMQWLRDENKQAIVANARSADRAKRFLKWS